MKIEKESTFSEKLPCAKESMERENESSDHINKYDLDDIDFIDMGRLIGVFNVSPRSTLSISIQLITNIEN